METLPVEILREIGKLLTGQDLASLSAVSRELRDCLNDNLLWRRHCDPQLAEYLKTTRCQVEPGFTSPEVEGSGLSSICEWRMCFMRQVHLHNNYRNNRFTTKTVPLSGKVLVTFFYDNNTLIIINDKAIEIWSIEESLSLLCSEPLNLGTSTQCKGARLCGDLIVIQKFDLFEVFKFSISRKRIEYLHGFNCGSSRKNTRRLAEWEIHNRPKDVSFDLVCYTLVVLRKTQNRLYVWNVQTGEKIREVRMANVVFQTFQARSSSQIPYCCIRATREENRNRKIVLVYKVPDFTLVFTSKPSQEYTQSHSAVIGDYIVFSTYESIDVYSLINEQVLITITDKMSVLNFHITANSAFFPLNRTLGKFTPGKGLQCLEVPNLHVLQSTITIFMHEKFFICGRIGSSVNVRRQNFLAEIKDGKVQTVPGPFLWPNCFITSVNQSKTKMWVVSSFYPINWRLDYLNSIIVEFW